MPRQADRLALNRGFEYRKHVDEGADGLTALAYLTGKYRHSSEEDWRKRLERGEVTFDGLKAEPETILRPGRLLSWYRPPWSEADVPLVYAVLHRDEDLLAVAKPRGLPCLPGGGFLEHTLLALVREHCPDAAPVHRLGRDTSGAVLFARTPSGTIGSLPGLSFTHRDQGLPSIGLRLPLIGRVFHHDTDRGRFLTRASGRSMPHALPADMH